MVGAGTAFSFIPVSIGALAGVAERDAGVASGLMNTSQQLGGAIGVAVASTVAATHSRLLLSQGHAPAAALTGGFQWALWVCGLAGLAAVPVTFLLVRRTRTRPGGSRRPTAEGRIHSRQLIFVRPRGGNGRAVVADIPHARP